MARGATPGSRAASASSPRRRRKSHPMITGCSRCWRAPAARLLHAGLPEEARQSMARAIDCASPLAGEIAYRAAQFLMTLKHYAEAALLIERALLNDPRDTALISTLRVAMQKSARYPEAVEAFARGAEP